MRLIAVVRQLEHEAAAALRFARDWFATIFTAVIVAGILLGLVRL
jgi:hypothetical protein